MGHRLSKIYTRTGDNGTTGIAGNIRVVKDSSRIEAIGTIDELNSLIGIVLAYNIPDTVTLCLNNIQNDLFDLGGELAMPEHQAINQPYIDRIESELDRFNEALPVLKEFILPAGGLATSSCHLARSVCRRAERNMVSLHRDEALNPLAIAYINRLSDLLFVIARVLSRHENGSEVLWQPRKNAHD
ncbi:MAG: cob(I)yrinic acid a,c-diamide adenosyltransferase [Gammaproteobacteria bacterium]|nr:cob(I)yrinic acid a,c-diamide adenosyltransferase [Gammaproteobacteria bacterium]